MRPRDLRPVVEAGADFIARMGWNALRLQRLDGSPFDLFGMLAKVKRKPMETKVQVDEGQAALQPPGSCCPTTCRSCLKMAAAETSSFP